MTFLAHSFLDDSSETDSKVKLCVGSWIGWNLGKIQYFPTVCFPASCQPLMRHQSSLVSVSLDQEESTNYVHHIFLCHAQTSRVLVNFNLSFILDFFFHTCIWNRMKVVLWLYTCIYFVASPLDLQNLSSFYLQRFLGDC